MGINLFAVIKSPARRGVKLFTRFWKTISALRRPPATAPPETGFLPVPPPLQLNRAPQVVLSQGKVSCLLLLFSLCTCIRRNIECLISAARKFSAQQRIIPRTAISISRGLLRLPRSPSITYRGHCLLHYFKQ